MTTERLIAIGNWVLCKPLKPQERLQGGLWVPVDWDKNVRSEGVAEVVAVGPGKACEDGYVDHGLRPGDRVIYRGFLRYANQIGELAGYEKASDLFAVDAYDVLAVVEGSGGIIGLHGEYAL